MIFENLKTLACKHFGITKDQLEKGGRKIEIVYAKIAISKVLHNTGTSIAVIANMLGMNRATVYHYFETFDDRLKYDSKFRENYENFYNEVD